MTVRLATWNIHGFVGRGWRPDPERTLRVIAALRADVLALQEVDGRTHLGRRPHAFETLREALGGHVAEARLFGPPGQEYGHMLWSRWPIRRAQVHLLPGPGREPRAAIDALVDAPGRPLRVLAVHLGLRARGRRNQAEALAALVNPGEASVLMGDLNEWRADGPVHRELEPAWPAALRPPTFPARRPLLPMDRIHASAGAVLRRLDPPAEAASASDHLPLAAECEWVSPMPRG